MGITKQSIRQRGNQRLAASLMSLTLLASTMMIVALASPANASTSARPRVYNTANPTCDTSSSNETVCVEATQTGLLFQWTNKGGLPPGFLNFDGVDIQNENGTYLGNTGHIEREYYWSGSSYTAFLPLPAATWFGIATAVSGSTNNSDPFNLTVGPGQPATPPLACPTGFTTDTLGATGQTVSEVLAFSTKTNIVATDTNGCAGYLVSGSNGEVDAVGGAPFLGDLSNVQTGGLQLNAPIIDLATTKDDGGYYLLGADGGIFSFGDAQFYGSTGGTRLNKPVVDMATAPDGKGYWLVASDGGIFSFGDAQFYGSMGGHQLNQPVVGMAATPDGGGYWLVASDGGIFSFGDAQFYGSMGGLHLNRPVVGMTTNPAGGGYRMVASDGGIFSFGAPFYGSLGGQALPEPIESMAPSVDGNGYYMLNDAGDVYAFGDAPYISGVREVPYG